MQESPPKTPRIKDVAREAALRQREVQDLVAQEPAHGAVLLGGHDERPRHLPQARDQKERDLFSLAPRDAADLAVGHEAVFRPDAVGVEAAPDAGGQRHRVAVVQEHHPLAEELPRRPLQEEELDHQQQAEGDAEGQRQPVVGRPPPRPDEEGVAPAAERARAGEGPTLIECKTMRMRGHAEHDDASYVPPKLLEEWRAKDPIQRLERTLREAGILTDAEEKRIEAGIDITLLSILDIPSSILKSLCLHPFAIQGVIPPFGAGN